VATQYEVTLTRTPGEHTRLERACLINRVPGEGGARRRRTAPTRPQHLGADQLLAPSRAPRLPAGDRGGGAPEQRAGPRCQGTASATPLLERLLEIEVAATPERWQRARVRFARYPVHKTLHQCNIDFHPSLDRKQVGELSTLRLVEARHNVILLGSPGVGKSHLAIALGIAATKRWLTHPVPASDLVAFPRAGSSRGHPALQVPHLRGALRVGHRRAGPIAKPAKGCYEALEDLGARRPSRSQSAAHGPVPAVAPQVTTVNGAHPAGRPRPSTSTWLVPERVRTAVDITSPPVVAEQVCGAPIASMSLSPGGTCCGNPASVAGISTGCCTPPADESTSPDGGLAEQPSVPLLVHSIVSPS
jgi:hypothetical protein